MGIRLIVGLGCGGDDDLSFAASFRFVHRLVGLLEEVLGLLEGAGPVEVGDADADTDGDVLSVEPVGQGEFVHDPVGERASVARLADDDELIATQPGDEVAVANHADQSLGEGSEECVADVVAVHVVDLFEAVEIEEDHRGGLAPGEAAVER